jgi:hypothetical protein
MSTISRYARLWLVIAAAALTIGTCCMLRTPPRNVIVEYVVPDGFRGIALVVEDASGDTPAVRTEGRAEVYIYRVARDARLVTRDLRPFYTWHKVQARYYDGTKLPARGFDEVGDNDVALVEISGNEILVGTVQDGKEYWRRQGEGPPVTPGPLGRAKR